MNSLSASQPAADPSRPAIDIESLSSTFGTRYDELVRGLYRAAAGDASWSEACASIADALDLAAVQIIGVDRKTGEIRFSWDGGTLPAQVWLEYFTRYHHINPRIESGFRAPLNGWTHDREIFDDAFCASHPFYRDFIDTYGLRHSSGLKIIEDADLVVFFSVHPHSSRSPLRRDEIAYLERLCVHVVACVQLHLRLQRQAADSLVARAMLDAIDQPILLIDDTQAIHHANLAARDLLTTGQSIRQVDNTLRFMNRVDADRLCFALREIGIGGQDAGRGRRGRAALRVGRAGMPPEYLLTLVAVRPELTGGVFGRFARAIVLLHPLRSQARIDPLLLGHLYGMTPAEAIVAAGVANGDTVSELAADRGVSVATVRTQLREVFAKVGVERQADLTRILHNTPLEHLESNHDMLIL